MDLERWRQLMKLWGAANHVAVYRELVGSYSEPHRYYHTVDHIVDCLEQFDQVHVAAESREEVELALWFHDAIYKPVSSKNEIESAEWAVDFVRSVGAPEAKCDRVYGHILATKHEAQPTDADSTMLVDIDLSILGRAPEAYDRFEENVRKEYKWVPWSLYRRKRREILSSFLERDNIYFTDHFRDKYEQTARRNLEKTIKTLS